MIKLEKRILFIFIFILMVLSKNVFANTVYDRSQIVTQQISLLQTRLAQANLVLSQLQHHPNTQLISFSQGPVDKKDLDQAELAIAIAKSNRDSISIELTDSQQTLDGLHSTIQEIENQLNFSNVFRMNNSEDSNVNNLRADLNEQKNLLVLEKQRASYLQKLQDVYDQSLLFYEVALARINYSLKSHNVMQLKEQQFKSELGYQQQQSYWLQQLNALYAEMSKTPKDFLVQHKLEREIFYANENVNYIYLEMLLARYQDEIQQLRISVSSSRSVGLLNKVSEQSQSLGKQLIRVENLLTNRLSIIEKRKALLTINNTNVNSVNSEIQGLTTLQNQYKNLEVRIGELTGQIQAFRTVLDQALQQELSSRQGLPGFGVNAWQDVGEEIVLVPSLALQIFKNLINVLNPVFDSVDYRWYTGLFILEGLWILLFSLIYLGINKITKNMDDHERGHINLKWVAARLLQRNLIDISIIGNVYGFLLYCGLALQSFGFLFSLSLVWLGFRAVATLSKLCLIESIHDRTGQDVRLYYRLRGVLLIGGAVTLLTVFLNQLPVIYELKDLFNRLFLLFLLVTSIVLLRFWKVVPGLVLPYVDPRRTYLQKSIVLLGVLTPIILLVNSVIGLFGFINLVLTISWYEGIFVLVLIGFLVLRGVLNEIMDRVSQFFIQHIANGWLLTESLLKPINGILQIGLFLMAWAVLFIFYGWDRQSPVVERLHTLLSFKLVEVFNTSITPMSLIEISIMVSLFYWAARWTREFVYRFLFSRTKDLGLRNSIAIFSQYTVIVLGILICLRVVGIDFRALTVVAGMFAFSIGLGLRDLANNFVCGFLLLIERPLQVGDTVSVTGYEGDVVHIGGRAVTIRTWDHIDVFVPNSEIFSKSFVNWTAKDKIVRSLICIKINSYDNPHEVQRVIYEVLASNKNILKDPPSEVFLKDLGEGTIELEVRYFLNIQTSSRVALRSEVLKEIWDAFIKNGIKIPSPHHEILLKGGLPQLTNADMVIT